MVNGIKEDVEYFKVDMNIYHVIRWLKKPKNNRSIKQSFLSLKEDKNELSIGVGKKLVKRIRDMYNKIKIDSFPDDESFNIIATKLSLPKDLVILIIKTK